MPTMTFEGLFHDQLKDIYDAEKRITKALPKMVENARSEELSDALQRHLEQTEGQIERLDRVFELLGQTPARKSCEAIQGLLAEGDSLMEESDDDRVTDAAIIAAAQKVEHYEIASYGTLREWARMLGREDVADTLQETLDEEGDADRALTRLAQNLNLQAAEHANGETRENGEEASRPSRGESRSTGARSRSGGTATSSARSKKH
jgi:ferritin-like metal-binding protein YciE